MEFIDTHCHLDFPDFAPDLAAVLDRAKAAGVARLITIGTGAASSRQAVELAAAHQGVAAAVGIHPNHAHEATPADLAAIAKLAQRPEVVAIGETGLDFYRNTAPEAVQRATFIQQLEIAAACDKPVVLHARQSGAQVMDIIEEFLRKNQLRGVFHCFTDTEETLRRALAVGFKIGVSGIVTFPKGDNVRALVAQTPDDFLLLDSDSPFLAPAPGRGARNEPARVGEIARQIAEIKGITLADVARITTRNARELFFPADLAEAEAGKIAYVIRNTLYLGITNACNNNCEFCARNRAYRVKGHDIKLRKDPEAAEVIAAMGDIARYAEVCFCGFGESTLRLEVLKAVADEIKRRGKPVRLNTNGLGSLYHGRDIVPELAGRIDQVSISLNTADPAQYEKLCRPAAKAQAYGALCDFVKRCVGVIPQVVCTAVEMPGIDLEAVQRKARELGADFRARSFVDVG